MLSFALQLLQHTCYLGPDILTLEDYWSHLDALCNANLLTRSWCKRVKREGAPPFSNCAFVSRKEIDLAIMLGCICNSVHHWNTTQDNQDNLIHLEPLLCLIDKPIWLEKKRLNYVTWRIANIDFNAMFHHLLEGTTDAPDIFAILDYERNVLIHKDKQPNDQAAVQDIKHSNHSYKEQATFATVASTKQSSTTTKKVATSPSTTVKLACKDTKKVYIPNHKKK